MTNRNGSDDRKWSFRESWDSGGPGPTFEIFCNEKLFATVLKDADGWSICFAGHKAFASRLEGFAAMLTMVAERLNACDPSTRSQRAEFLQADSNTVQ